MASTDNHSNNDNESQQLFDSFMEITKNIDNQEKEAEWSEQSINNENTSETTNSSGNHESEANGAAAVYHESATNNDNNQETATLPGSQNTANTADATINVPNEQENVTKRLSKAVDELSDLERQLSLMISAGNCTSPTHKTNQDTSDMAGSAGGTNHAVAVTDAPVAKGDDPTVAKDDIPVTKGNAPVAKDDILVAKGDAPVAKDDIPVAKDNALVAKDDIPVAEGDTPSVAKDGTDVKVSNSDFAVAIVTVDGANLTVANKDETSSHEIVDDKVETNTSTCLKDNASTVNSTLESCETQAHANQDKLDCNESRIDSSFSNTTDKPQPTNLSSMDDDCKTDKNIANDSGSKKEDAENATSTNGADSTLEKTTLHRAQAKDVSDGRAVKMEQNKEASGDLETVIQVNELKKDKGNDCNGQIKTVDEQSQNKECSLQVEMLTESQVDAVKQSDIDSKIQVNQNTTTSGNAFVMANDSAQIHVGSVPTKCNNDDDDQLSNSLPQTHSSEQDGEAEEAHSMPSYSDIEILTTDESGISERKSLESLDTELEGHEERPDSPALTDEGIDSDARSLDDLDDDDDDEAFNGGSTNDLTKDNLLKVNRNRMGSNSSTVSEREFRNSTHGKQDSYDHAKVHIKGYLMKLGGSGLTPKNWRKRWFVLKEDNCLYYYKQEKNKVPCGVIVLFGYSITKAPDASRRYCFKLNKGGARTYHFCADSDENMRGWVVALMKAASADSDKGSSFQILEGNVHNVSIPALSIKDPECHGYLSKQGLNIKKWKRRYCVLKNGYLYYYSDMSNTTALGVAKLLGYEIACGDVQGKHFCFNCNPPVESMRVYHFSAETENDRERWIKRMKESIKRGDNPQ